MLDKNQLAFFELLRAGLWEKEAQLSVFDAIDFNDVYQIAEGQSVVGLVAAGMEHATNVRVPQTTFLFFVGNAIQIEQRNKAMNAFVARLIERLRETGICAVLVKGQGIAQCYERPLWRACGDVDLLLSEENYEKAKALLLPLATDVETEYTHFKHQGMTIDGWVVELHGTLHSRLFSRMDKVVDEVQEDVFCGGKVRSVTFNDNDRSAMPLSSLQNYDDNFMRAGAVQVFLPAPDEDVFFVFIHFLGHFFLEGIGLRQICDWCRLLYTYKDTLNVLLLESRLKKAGLMSEWKTFAALAVDYLGMPVEAMPFYSDDKKWKRKAVCVMEFVLETGNFGHNRDYSYQKKYPYVVYKAMSLWRHLVDTCKYSLIFPLDSMKVLIRRLHVGFAAAVRGD